MCPWSMTGVSAKMLSSGAWPPSTILIALWFLGSPSPYPHQGSNCRQLVSPDHRLHTGPGLAFTQSKPAHYLLSSLVSFPRGGLLTLHKVRCELMADGQSWEQQVPAYSVCGWENTPFWMLYLKKSQQWWPLKGKPVDWRKETKGKNMPGL